MKNILLIFLLIFLNNCKENYPTYSTKITKPIKCISYDMFINDEDKNKIEKRIKIKETKKCQNILTLTKYHIGECNNPRTKSTGSDFDGYIRIEINNGKKNIYKVQSNFKNEKEEAFKRVLKKISKDMAI